jgi:hypothetical protein
MADTSLREEILQEVNSLTPEMQSRVLQFARKLADEPNKDSSGKGILSLAGSMAPEEADEMIKLIDEDCESVDADEW